MNIHGTVVSYQMLLTNIIIIYLQCRLRFFVLRDYVDYGLLTLAATYATNFGGVFDWLINTLFGLENAATSVEVNLKQMN